MSENDVKGSINATPAVRTNYLTVEEDFVPVRTTDLERIKRDVLNIPDGQGRFDNAFWGFLGLGVPVILDSIINGTNKPDFIINLFIGILLAVVAVVFKIMGHKSKQDRDKRIQTIVEDIDVLDQKRSGSVDPCSTVPPAKHWWEKLLRRLIGFGL